MYEDRRRNTFSQTLKATYDYKVNRNAPINLDFIDISWSKKLTESNINKACAICGTSSDIPNAPPQICEGR